MNQIIEIIMDKINPLSISLTALSMFLSGLLTALFENISDFFFRLFNLYKIRKNKVEFDLKKISCFEHGSPEILLKNISFKDSDQSFYLSYSSDSDIFLENYHNINTIIKSVNTCFSTDKASIELLENCRNTVKKEADSSLFNKELIGIRSIHFLRKGDNEEPGFIISYYKTNYFTDRVMSLFYESLDINSKTITKNNLNLLPYLLTSITVKPLIDFKDKQILMLNKDSSNSLIFKLNSKLYTNFKKEMEAKSKEYFNIPGLRFESIRVSDVFCSKKNINFTIGALAYTSSSYMDSDKLLIEYKNLKELSDKVKINKETINDTDYGLIAMFASKKGSNDVY